MASASAAPAEGSMRAGDATELPPFKLERYFAKWEFTAPHLLCCSDCEPLQLGELLGLADKDSLSRWENLRLSYGETRGMPELREEIAKLYDSVTPDNVIVAAPQECVYLAMRALLRPGDHVVVTYPGYQSLYQMALSLGCEVELWGLELGPEGAAAFDVEKFKALLRPTTRLAVVNFPHNPSGWLPGGAQWGDIVGACRGVGAHLFSDEIYRLMEFDPAARLPAAADVYDKAISLGGLSKAFGLPGLRVGWLAVQPAMRPFLDRVAELRDYTTICGSQPSELLGLVALRAREAVLERSMRTVRGNLEVLAAFMKEWSHVFRYSPPAAGSVGFPSLQPLYRPGESVEAFCDRLVQACGVLLLPASVYDHCPSEAGRHFRVGLGRRDLPACLEVLRGFLREEAGLGPGGAEGQGGAAEAVQAE
ncbi:hypothetical protein HYH03_007873 [Edaphochlamys debaryana]|uniref:Aminotransferase class I/classII large domain-containing protein n=1 Tax=Edaphochlamys debaryana TaxID=47281 RepID=A0A835Y3E0_9CHLO|nr:hypothetical protein HYH03_007873 [Edaphochlamys debaryana]|eukprot:KAG2493943.1 hypothetical protein HYH03_007873 [Edaphochlamys debaryana]